MKIDSLRTKAFLNLLMVLFFALLLTHFILLAIVQSHIVSARTKKATHALQDTARQIQTGVLNLVDVRTFFMGMPYTHVFIRHKDQDGMLFGTPDPDLNKALIHLADTVEAKMQIRQEMWGQSWALLWRHPSKALIAMPFKNGHSQTGVLSVACTLEDIYADMRPALKIGWVYIGLNTLLFSLIGIYRLSNILFKPLVKLTKRAEAYDPDQGEFWLDTYDGNDFRRLSASMQRIFNRLKEDQRQLKDTVAALEKSNRKLTQAQAEMVRAEKLAAVGRISAGIAHEIGNPIGIVSGYLEMLRQDDGSEKDRREFVERSIDEIERINRIIRQMLDFARSTGESEAPVSVHGIIQDVHAVLAVNPLSRGVRIELDLNASRDCVRADADQIRQVILNVVLNALDAVTATGGDSPWVQIESSIKRVERSGAASLTLISIVCSDNGSGIGDDKLAYVLEPFYTTKAPGKGTGLGLAVSYMIVENMGGRLKVRNRPEGGAQVTIDLPVNDTTLHASAEEPCQPS